MDTILTSPVDANTLKQMKDTDILQMIEWLLLVVQNHETRISVVEGDSSITAQPVTETAADLAT
jgi:hypothetical protein